jgi:phasin family protein
MLQCINRVNHNNRGVAMNDQIFNSFKDQSEKLLAPSRELNKLAVAKFEQLAALQFASLRAYTDLNLGQLKAATEISGPEGIQDYLGKQREFLKTVGEKLTSDARAMAELGKEFTEDAQKIARENFAAVTKEVA